jgi:methionyl-tRNA synthetase
MSERLYVTTTIPYVNAPPHVGFALELVQADAIARYHRLLGAAVRLQTGTDENAFKNVLSAREQGLPVRELVDRNAARFRELVDALDISAGSFVRTATPEHRRAVETFLGRLSPDDLYRAAYRGLYCPGCEDFLLERDLDPGGGCPDHGEVIVPTEEANVFFRLSRYRDALAERVRSGDLDVVPGSRRSEVLAFIERGLQDISISRDAERSGGWGIPFPGDSTQVVYVWIDALVNYLTGLGYPGGDDHRRYWCGDGQRVHVVGKNVWKFHAVYWPALLLSAGLPLPNRVIVHGFLTQDGRKISKSRGGSADPVSYIESFGADAVRYFLLRHVRPFEDSDFSEARLEGAYRSELANGLGNLCSRLAALCGQFGVAAPAPRDREPPPAEVHAHLEGFRFDRALDALWREVDRINREIAAARPWDASSGASPDEVRTRLARWAGELRRLGGWLSPFLPGTSARLERAFSDGLIERSPPLFPL